MDVRRALLAAALLVLAPAALAEEARKPVEIKLGRVTLQIVDTESGEQELRDGTRVLVKDAIITPGLAATFKDTTAQVFTVSQGGNACEGWPAVVTVDKAGKVAIDTSMSEECMSLNASADEDGFTFVEPVVPDQDGSVWRFMPERGMTRTGVLVFRAWPHSTWNDLDRLTDHPLSLFYSAPFDAAVRKLAGKQFSELATRLRVAGPVEKKGNYLIATGCQAHACNSDRGFVAIDRKAHTVFLAMRSDDNLKTWPKAATWPAAASAALGAWEKAN
ncbi:MAG: hypothetical protein JO000_05070 [Alphaproteobacteria bacterium]|nr:hypothetical protein [Alphaproteobacteria bacterium]